jgi:LuxR family maltose regulon positive regulatory protein
MQARLLTARNKLPEALHLLSCLEESARSGGRTGRLIEILILQALALEGLGEPALALATLAKSLALAEPEGYIRVFLDEGQPMQNLLKVAGLGLKVPALQAYITRLLASFERHHPPRFPEEQGGPESRDPAAHDRQSSTLRQAQGRLFNVQPLDKLRAGSATLPEPLSPRELEVLQLIALGRTNLEIARQLIVSPGTVKAHTASIYRKLDVANRTEAVARARQLGILP